jgi:hypothetical protein
MKQEIYIATFAPVEPSGKIGGPASLRKVIKGQAGEALTTLTVDQDTLRQCVESAQSLLAFIREASHGLTPDSITIQLGVSTTGKVGFLGTGIDVHLAATIQLHLKVS